MQAAMRRVLVLLTVVLVLVGEGLAQATPRGAPTTLRAARPADHSDHRRLAEWWTARFVAPSSRGWLEIRAYREGSIGSVRVIGASADGRPVFDSFGSPRLTADQRSLRAQGPAGRLAVRRRGRDIVLAGPAVQGRLRLLRGRTGPAATGWRLGEAVRYPSGRRRPVTLNWSMLVATAVTRGTLTVPGGPPLPLDGWRASYEHGWGDILPGDREWAFWDQAIVHAGGRAWIAYGLNRTDTVTGPGARDAQWLGLFARVDRRGVRVCRPRVRRSGWQLIFPEFVRWPTRMLLRCGGTTLRLRDARAVVDEYVTHIEARSRTAAGAHRSGFAMHLSHPG